MITIPMARRAPLPLSAVAAVFLACAAPAPEAKAPVLAAPSGPPRSPRLDDSREPGIAEAPARFRTCTESSDCAAVARAGCCHNGWKEAVASSQSEAYARELACTDPHAICPMYLVIDNRRVVCDRDTHLCAMISPAEAPSAPPSSSDRPSPGR
jgi:hypothetical protein